jgi:hypothetical protein
MTPTCAACRFFLTTTVYRLRADPYNCSRHKLIVASTRKACGHIVHHKPTPPAQGGLFR